MRGFGPTTRDPVEAHAIWVCSMRRTKILARTFFLCYRIAHALRHPASPLWDSSLDASQIWYEGSSHSSCKADQADMGKSLLQPKKNDHSLVLGFLTVGAANSIIFFTASC